MPVTKVIIENFKGIRDQVEIPIRPITLLFGGNSAGKSTILHALLYFREILENQNVDADVVTGGGQDISLGGFRELVHEHNENSRVTLGVELDIADDGLQPYPVFESALINEEGADDLDEATKRLAIEGENDLRESGITEINSASIFVTVGIPKSESTPKVLEYRVEINGILFAKISGETRLMTAIEDINT
ncbi:ATP-binding protein, partial [Akkermansiaceae bacterium]|nr:ATP-binding protein [Akkermansiaceae bacterium]